MEVKLDWLTLAVLLVLLVYTLAIRIDTADSGEDSARN
jgi:hypothetical protein